MLAVKPVNKEVLMETEPSTKATGKFMNVCLNSCYVAYCKISASNC